MADLPVLKKNFEIQYRGAAPLDLATAPFVGKLLKAYRRSTGSALAIQSFAGSFNGATPGGAVTQFLPGRCYRIVAALYDGSWSIPDSIDCDDIPYGGAATPPANQIPFANAGTDAAFQLPTNSILLTGTGTDGDGTIASYAWSQVSGPNTAGGVPAATQNTTAFGLIAGEYVFMLTVTDNAGATKTDTVTVTVAPAAVGSPPTVTLAANPEFLTQGQSTTLTATASDTDGTVTKVEFFSGSNKLGEALAAPFTYVYTPATIGVKSLTAKATDNGGNVTTSAVKQVSVTSSTEIFQELVIADSLGTSYPQTMAADATSFPGILQTMLDANFWKTDPDGFGIGFPNKRIDEILAGIAGLDAMRRADTTKCFVFVRAGINNMAQGQSVDTAFAQLVQLCDALNTRNMIPLVCTLTIARSGDFFGYTNYTYAASDAWRADFNARVIANAASQLHCPVVIDLASDYQLARLGYGAQQSDGIHETIYGRTRVATQCKTGLLAAAAGQTGVVVPGEAEPAPSTEPEVETVVAFDDNTKAPASGNMAQGGNFRGTNSYIQNGSIRVFYTRGIRIGLDIDNSSGVLNAVMDNGSRLADRPQIFGQATFEVHGRGGMNYVDVGKSPNETDTGAFFVWTGCRLYS